MRSRFKCLVMVLAAYACAGSLYAAPDAPSRVMLGQCELTLDPETAAGRDAVGFTTCVKVSLGAEMVFVSGTPAENSWMRYAHAYGGAFISDWLSLQARGRWRHVAPRGDQALESEELLTEYAVLQIGNPALHRMRLTAGRIRLPFGIDRSSAVETYRKDENRRFWESPENTLYVTLDDRRALQAEIGVAGDAPVKEKEGMERDDDEEPLRRAVSLRLSTDFAALDGSRLVLSGYGDGAGARRFGAGFITVSAQEDTTQFEFVRRLPKLGDAAAAFEQLLRVAYLGAWRGDTRWIVQIDDERERFRRGLVGHDAKVFDHFIFRFALSYYKYEDQSNLRRWYVISGLEARL